MPESAAPDDDFDYLADAPPVTGSEEYDEIFDDENVEQTSVPITRTRLITETRESPAWPKAEAPPGPNPNGFDPAALKDVQQAGTSQADVRIALWGAPRAGKTTYLSALSIAAQKPVMGRQWSISGCDAASSDFLEESVKRFVRDKDFPMPTRGYRTLSWKLEGTRHRTYSGRLGKLRGKLLSGDNHEIDREFVVEMQDAAGEMFGDGVDKRYSEGVQNHLMNAHGIVYVFDPLGNREAKTKSFDFFFETLSRLKRGMRERGLLSGSRLPHFVSVCVTKFDDPEIFNAAMKEGIVYQENEDSMPVVPASIAPDFLRSLCHDEGSLWVCDQLQTEFVPGRVNYFATSAVGFRLNNGRFNGQNFSNVDADGLHFHSAARPINVLEPIISLERRIREEGTA